MKTNDTLKSLAKALVEFMELGKVNDTKEYELDDLHFTATIVKVKSDKLLALRLAGQKTWECSALIPESDFYSETTIINAIGSITEKQQAETEGNTEEFLNRVEIIGVVGRSDIKQMGCGHTRCDFSVVTSYLYQEPNGQRYIEHTWHAAVAEGPKPGWPDLKELNKGTNVHIIGRIKSIRYADDDGRNRYKQIIMVQELSVIKNEKILVPEEK